MVVREFARRRVPPRMPIVPANNRTRAEICGCLIASPFPCFSYTAALTSRATRLPDSSAPCIQPSIHTEVCSPAKWILPSGRATCGNSELNWPGL